MYGKPGLYVQLFVGHYTSEHELQGSIEVDEAAIASARLNLSFTKITAPISGTIGLRQIDAGNMIHSSDTTGLAVITQVQPISVLFSIPEDQLPPIRRKFDQGIHPRVKLYDPKMGRELGTGTLAAIDNEIDQTTGTARLVADFRNRNLALFPNQFVNVRLQLDRERGVLIVPAIAIHHRPAGDFVYLLSGGNTVAIRRVQTGHAENGNASIREGLRPGDRVVIDGAENLQDGSKVIVRQHG